MKRALLALTLTFASIGSAPPPDNLTLTAVDGIKVGRFTLAERPTGCTVVLARDGTTGGVDVRGGAPGTRETDLLNPVNDVQIVNAIVLSGGSAYGLDSASGTMKWLDEHHIGYGDVIFSLATGTWSGTAEYGTIGALAADAIAEAVVRAAVQATASHGLPSARDLGTIPARFR